MTTTSNASSSSRPAWLTARTLALALVAVGLFISGYLSYVKWSASPSTCVAADVFNCNMVLNSAYAELAGIPIAYLGFLTYAVLGALFLLETRVAFVRDYGYLLVFGLGVFAWVFSMWLVYVQVFLLQTLCSWCLSHEANFTLLFALICYSTWRRLANTGEA